jgi:glycosyltransferase involved in cell wall biosynthesis
MKVIFNCPVPFWMAHGGQQIQIEQTMAALEKIGVTVEPLRWWDPTQTGDVLHHFNRIPMSLLQRAQRKGVKVVMADLMTGQGSRKPLRLGLQRLVTRAIRTALPHAMWYAFNWDSYAAADACVANTAWEAHLMSYLFGAAPERVFVVPNGVEDVFLHSTSRTRGKWLVCTATIIEHKRVLELAQAGIAAGVPVWIIGKPISEGEPYARRFCRLAEAHPDLVRYEGAVNDRGVLARVYREARGFVLLSTKETLSLSSFEAAACECPLLLSDLPWARWTFKELATYCPITKSVSATAAALRAFYDQAPRLPLPPKPSSWVEVARQFRTVYERVLQAPEREKKLS